MRHHIWATAFVFRKVFRILSSGHNKLPCNAQQQNFLKQRKFYFFSWSRTNSAKSWKESPCHRSAPSTWLKKQLGISCKRKFLLMQGAHPFSCLVGCSGQSKFLQVQKGLKFAMKLSSSQQKYIRTHFLFHNQHAGKVVILQFYISGRFQHFRL